MMTIIVNKINEKTNKIIKTEYLDQSLRDAEVIVKNKNDKLNYPYKYVISEIRG